MPEITWSPSGVIRTVSELFEPSEPGAPLGHSGIAAGCAIAEFGDASAELRSAAAAKQRMAKAADAVILRALRMVESPSVTMLCQADSHNS